MKLYLALPVPYLAIITLIAPVAFAQKPVFKEEKFHGRHAFVLENGIIRVSALAGGGHIAEIRFLSSDARKTINPMRVPHYPTIEPHQYDPARHDALYGDGPHRWLSAGYMGHLLCFPSFGAPSSDQEVKNQLGNHGEAPIVEWKKQKVEVTPDLVRLWYGADLPKTQYRVDRVVTLRAGETAVHIEESVENLAAFDRPVNWVQHATFGAPFAAPGKSWLDASATRGEVSPRAVSASLKSESHVNWPRGVAPDGSQADLRVFQPLPHSGTYYGMLMDQQRPESWFTMYNADYPVLIGYVYPTADNPWLGDWQENMSNKTLPWNGQAVARGLEFGTTPMPEGLRRSVERGKMYGVPTYRWIGGRQRLTTTWSAFLAEIPAGFSRVADLTREPGALILKERSTTRTLRVPAR